MSKAAQGTRPVTRCLAYLRVSTEEQARNGNGLDAQHDGDG